MATQFLSSKHPAEQYSTQLQTETTGKYDMLGNEVKLQDTFVVLLYVQVRVNEAEGWGRLWQHLFVSNQYM